MPRGSSNPSASTWAWKNSWKMLSWKRTTKSSPLPVLVLFSKCLNELGFVTSFLQCNVRKSDIPICWMQWRYLVWYHGWYGCLFGWIMEPQPSCWTIYQVALGIQTAATLRRSMDTSLCTRSWRRQQLWSLHGLQGKRSVTFSLWRMEDGILTKEWKMHFMESSSSDMTWRFGICDHTEALWKRVPSCLLELLVTSHQ